LVAPATGNVGLARGLQLSAVLFRMPCFFVFFIFLFLQYYLND